MGLLKYTAFLFAAFVQIEEGEMKQGEEKVNCCF